MDEGKKEERRDNSKSNESALLIIPIGSGWEVNFQTIPTKV